MSTIISKSEPIKVTFVEGTAMEDETESDIGRAKEIIEVDYAGERLTMNFMSGSSWTWQTMWMERIS